MATEGDTQIDTGEGHGSGLEQTPSEPKQGNKQPTNWTPPPGNPGSDQDALENRKNGTAKTESG